MGDHDRIGIQLCRYLQKVLRGHDKRAKLAMAQLLCVLLPECPGSADKWTLENDTTTISLVHKQQGKLTRSITDKTTVH
jgi:hypothetical protein